MKSLTDKQRNGGQLTSPPEELDRLGFVVRDTFTEVVNLCELRHRFVMPLVCSVGQELDRRRHVFLVQEL